jgi:hypothetical protein
MRNASIALGVLAVLSVVPVIASSAEARQRRNHDTRDDYVTAVSRHNNGQVTGAVRGTDLGPQVQLPTGRWVYCRRSCSETLRVESIDFNQGDDVYLGKGTLGNECGIFGCLDIGLGRE